MRYNSFFQKQIFKRAAAVICVSRNLKKIIEQNYNVKKVYYVPHGIDTKVFRPFKKDPKLRSRLLGRKYKKICLIVGSYGTHEAVIQGLADYMKSTLFVRVNKNIEAQHIKNILYVSNLSEKELLNMYNVADIFFRPLNFATANNSILEAMTMQKIIVTSNVGGIREYLNNKSAYLVKDNNFKSAFEQILNNWQRAKSKAKEARRKAVKHFSWEIIAKKTYEIYKKVYNENTFHT
jgi:glycosyltransferase involved in cell wall biosynthesis